MTKYKINAKIERLDSEGATGIMHKIDPKQIYYNLKLRNGYCKIEKTIEEMAEKGLIKKARLRITFED